MMFITAEDEVGLIDMVLFPSEQRAFAKEVLSEPLCVFEGVVRKVGRKDVSVVIKWIKDLPSAMAKTALARNLHQRQPIHPVNQTTT